MTPSYRASLLRGLTLQCKVLRMADDLTPFDDPEPPSAARSFFFRDAGLPATGETIRWWEKRRLTYNVAVGAAGLGTLAVTNLLFFVAGGGPVRPPLLFFAVYGALATLFYTGGWVAELVLRRLFGRRTPVVAAALFRYGFAFAVGVTLLPIPVAIIGLVARLVLPLFG